MAKVCSCRTLALIEKQVYVRRVGFMENLAAKLVTTRRRYNVFKSILDARTAAAAAAAAVS